MFVEIFREMFRPDRDLIACCLSWLMAVTVALFIALSVAMIHDEWFDVTHKCVRDGEYWQAGHFVGVVGKGGYYQPAGMKWICYEWSPNDGTRPWLGGF